MDTTIVDNRASIPELSIDTQTLESELQKLAIGDHITYEALSKAINRDVQHHGRQVLTSARRRLQRHHRIIFGVIVNVGLKRLNDEGKIASARGHVSRGRNQFKMARQQALSVDTFDALPNHAKLEHHLVLAQATTLLHMTAPAATKKLTASVKEAQKQLTAKESLELMKGAL